MQTAETDESQFGLEAGWRWLSQRPEFIIALLTAVFALFRWWTRQSPWNSDDINYFIAAEELLSGSHNIFTERPLGHGALHHYYRFGIVGPTALAILVFGANATAYYAVTTAFNALSFALRLELLRRLYGWKLALPIAVLMAVWALELVHSSVLFVDHATGTMLLLATAACFPDELRFKERARRLAPHVAGAAIFFAYQLREGAPALFAPVALVMLLRPESRSALLKLGFTAAGLFFLEQVAFLSLGAPPLFRQKLIATEIAEYTRFPSFTFDELPGRHFSQLRADYGWANACLYLISLAAVVLSVFIARSWFVRTLSLVALLAWTIMSFAVMRVEGGRMLMMPTQPRLLATLTIVGFIAIAACAARVSRGLRGKYFVLALWIGVLALSLTAGFQLRGYLHCDESSIARVLAALSITSDAKEVLYVGRDAESLRLFGEDRRGASVRWRPVSIEDWRSAAESGEAEYLLMDSYFVNRGRTGRSEAWLDSVYPALAQNYLRVIPPRTGMGRKWLFRHAPLPAEPLQIESIGAWTNRHPDKVEVESSEVLCRERAAYLTTGPDASFNNGHEQDFDVLGGTELDLLWSNRGSDAASVYVLEYADEKRVGTRSFRLVSGRSLESLVLSAQTDSVRLAIRCDRAGRVALEKLSVFRFPPNAPRDAELDTPE